MGFFDSLFGKREESKPQTVQISSVSSIVQPKIDERMNELKPQFESFITHLRSNYEKLNSAINYLEIAPVVGQFDPQLLEVSLTSRQMFASKMKRIGDKISQTPEIKLDVLTDYINSLTKILEEINEGTIKEYQSISVVFKKETKQVLKEFKNVRKSLKDFGKRIKRENEILQSNLEILESGKKYGRTEKRISDSEEEIKKMEERFKTSQQEKDAMEKELNEIMNGDEWRNFQELRKNLNKMEIEHKQIISEVVQIFGSIERIMKKYSRTLDKDEMRELLESYINSPFDAFVNDNNREISKALRRIQESSGSVIELKGEEKSIERLKSMVESNLLERMWERNDFIMKAIENTNNDIESSEVLKKKNELEKESFNKTQLINSLQQNISDKKNQLEKLRKELEQNKITLENKLKDFLGYEVIVEN